MNQVVQRRVDFLISSTLENAFRQLYKYVDEGYATVEDITVALGQGWDFAVQDAWREYLDDGDC